MPRKKKERGTNPFLKGLVVKNLHKGRSYVSDGMGGVHLGSRDMLVEQIEKVSVYLENRNKLVAMELSSAGKNLLVWLLYNLRLKEDVVKIDRKRVAADTGVKSASVYRGIRNLEQANIIRRSAVGVYWINPYFFFRGSRVGFFNDLKALDVREVEIVEETENVRVMQEKRIKKLPKKAN